MGLVQDLRFALRVLARKPVFTIVVVVTLALGIGAGSAMYSIVDALLVRPLDLPGLDRLAVVQVMERGQGQFQENMSPRDYLDFREAARSFERMAAYQWWEVAITGEGEPEDVVGHQVDPGYFEMLGVAPILGRWFAADEVDAQKEKVVILSHALWDRRYGRDPKIVGKSIQLDGDSYTVVGVMPRGFHVPKPAQFWAPLTLTAEQRQERRGRYLGVMARLRPGVSLANADAELRQLGEAHAAQFVEDRQLKVRVVSLVRGITEDYTRNFILVLLGAALFVLLIACANVANLFLAHTLARRRELAVRAALGAGRGRIVRQLLTEAAVLGVVSGLISLLFAAWSVDAVKGALPLRIVRFVAGWENMGVNSAVLAFALGVGIVVGFLFGIMPAWQMSRTDLGSVLKEGDRGATAGRHTHLMRNALVVAQIALALFLLIGAGAMVKGFMRMAHPGPNLARNVLTFHVDLPGTRYPEKTQRLEFARRLLERLRGLPGVQAAAAVRNVPWGNHGSSRKLYPEGRILRPEQALDIDYRYLTPGYLELLRVPLVQGRQIADADDAAAPGVALLSVGAASRLWPNEPAVGKRFRTSDDEKAPWIKVVGIVADVNDQPSEYGAHPTIYVPFAQEGAPSLYFALRTAGDPLAMAHAAQAAVYAVDPELPVQLVRTLDTVLAERLAGFRIGSAMMGAFALLALILAAVGIYGVVATLATQRTHEIGVRMALGAQRGDVLRLILRNGVVLTVLGLVPGLFLGVLLVRFLGSVIVGAVDNDTIVFVTFTSVVAAMALVGSFVPAWRATKVDPMIALRDE
jgi:putative ABC transport system permease protein